LTPVLSSPGRASRHRQLEGARPTWLIAADLTRDTLKSSSSQGRWEVEPAGRRVTDGLAVLAQNDTLRRFGAERVTRWWRILEKPPEVVDALPRDCADKRAATCG